LNHFISFFKYILYVQGLLAHCLQCYCGEIRQMLTFLICLKIPKAYHRPDNSIRIVELHRKIIIPKPSNFTWPRTQDSFWVRDLCTCNLLAETKVLCRSIVLSFRATETIFIGTRTQDIFLCFDLCSCNVLAETNNFGLGAVRA
jgi:hypothetical protein